MAARYLGVEARTWDVSAGPAFDLTAPTTQRQVRQDISRGRLVAGMLAPPCGSFGPAGNRRHPIRSGEYPWGKPSEELSEREQLRIVEGNKTLKAALSIIGMLHRAKRPWIFEHPHASFAFKTPEMLRLAAAPRVHFRVLDQCRFGAKWRKRTRLMCGNLDEQDTESLERWCAGRGGLCGSGVKHWVLSGSCGGRALAEAYPQKMAQALARSLLAPLFGQVYNGLRNPDVEAVAVNSIWDANLGS